MTLQIDPGAIVAGCAAIGVLGAAAGWAARHFIRDVTASSDDSGESPGRKPGPVGIDRQLADLKADLANLSNTLGTRLTMADLIAALAKHEVSMIDRFNGRYPSKDVFLQGMGTVKDELGEVRKYIGDVRRDLAGRLTRLDERMGEKR